MINKRMIFALAPCAIGKAKCQAHNYHQEGFETLLKYLNPTQ